MRMVLVVIIGVLTFNRKSKTKNGWMDGCKKAGKVSRKKGKRHNELFLYFFHLFALNVDVCIVLLCMCVNKADKSTNKQHINCVYIYFSITCTFFIA
jgi:hypothetical protein